jgi:molybdopterin-guanine dinucleotide biosynthesis protein A
MGRDKALLPFRGGVLCQAVAGAVAQAAGNATLIGDPVRYRNLGYAAVADLYPGEGPLGGILTTLQHSNAEWNLIAACDLKPFEDAEVSLFQNVNTPEEWAGHAAG